MRAARQISQPGDIAVNLTTVSQHEIFWPEKLAK